MGQTSIQLGDFEVTPVTDGYFRLDGGSMFGIVPRVLWESKVTPDEQHRIRLAVRCLLVRNGRRTVLIDSGLGNKYSDEFRDRYAVEQSVTLIDSLRESGVRPEDVTDVINCHLHFDHAGWNTIRKDGRIVPTFPNARYWSQRGEWERAQLYAEQRDRASFFPDDFLPLEKDRWELVEGDHAVLSGMEILLLPGHTPHLQGVLLTAGERKVAFLGDLIPTAQHIPYAWIMAFDLHAAGTLATKRKILPRAVREKWVCILDHDPHLAAARIVEKSPGKLSAIPAEEFSSHGG